MSSLSTPRTAEATNEQAIALLEPAWRRTDALLDLVSESGLSARPIPLRHPFVFYLGHLPAFTWNMLGRSLLGRGYHHPELDRLFDFGIDPEEGETPVGPPEWPDPTRIRAYRDGVRDFVRSSAAAVAARADDDPLAAEGRIYHLVLEHELMHHETLLYMFHALRPGEKRRPRWWRRPETGPGAPPRPPVEIRGGRAVLGCDPEERAWGWDNEFPSRAVETPPFRLDPLPVTNGAFLELVRADGYRARELWDDRSYVWARRRGLAQPSDWLEKDGELYVRTIFEPVPFDAARDWPVRVSWSEACAYARFRGARLPREEELHRAAYGVDDSSDRPRPRRRHPWGDEPPAREHGAFDFHVHSAVPVGSRPAGRTPSGIEELVGNGWEWTETPFGPHEGFRALVDAYAGYSRDFFDGDHYVMFGGSWATDVRLLRRTFRNWFRFNYPYPFTKFRLAYDG